MADPMKGTPLEGFELPDDVFGLGAAELAYLMSRHETPAGERSRRLLMLDPRSAEDAALLAGASSLASRGWLTLTTTALPRPGPAPRSSSTPSARPPAGPGSARG